VNSNNSAHAKAKPRRILILAERFYPEEFLINDLALEWRRRGYEVEVLTQVPSYPYDRVYEGYRNVLYQTTRELPGIPVHRVKTVLGYNRTVGRKVSNYMVFAFLTTLWALLRGWRYDVVFAYHTGPLTMATAAVAFRFLWRRRTVIWSQDIWPDSVYAYGLNLSRGGRLALEALVRLIYSAYRTICVSCPGFESRLRPYTGRKIHYLPQWSKGITPAPVRKHSDVMVFTFAGNIGSVQNLELVVEAFGELNLPDAMLNLVGAGVFLDRLQQMVARRKYKNIVFTGRVPFEDIPKYFAESDILIISLRPELGMVIPAKFQAYLAAGMPIFGIISGDTAAMIRQHEIGFAVTSMEMVDVQKGFQYFMNHRDSLPKWRENALKLSGECFDRDKNIETLTRLFDI